MRGRSDYLWVVGGTRWPFVFGEHRQEHPRTTWNHLTESDMIRCHMCVHPYTSLVMIVAVFLNHWCKGMVNQQMRILFEWFWMKVLNELAQLTTLPMRHPRIQPLVAVGRWRLGFEAPNTPRIGDFPDTLSRRAACSGFHCHQDCVESWKITFCLPLRAWTAERVTTCIQQGEIVAKISSPPNPRNDCLLSTQCQPFWLFMLKRHIVM